MSSEPVHITSLGLPNPISFNSWTTGRSWYNDSTTGSGDWITFTVTTTADDLPRKRRRGRSVFYGGAKMQGYSMGEYNLYEVAALELPSKKGDFEGEGAKVLTFGPDKLRVVLVVAPNDDGAIVRAAKLINEEYDTNRLKVFVRPFAVEE